MVEWRAIGAGIAIFPVSVLGAAADPSPFVLFAGFPSGLLAGYLSHGLLSGSLSGLFTGGAIGLLFFGGFYTLIVTNSQPAAPGLGLSIVVVFLIAGLLAIESVIAGFVGGLVSRYVGS